MARASSVLPDAEAGRLAYGPLAVSDARGVHDGTPSLQWTWARKVGAAALAATLVLLAPAAVHLGHRSGPQWGAPEHAAEKTMVEFTPPTDWCSAPAENCMPTKCCKTAGHTCWRKDASSAQCGKVCPGGDCVEEKPWWASKPVVYTPGTSLFCYSVYVETAGPNISGAKDLALLKTQLKYGASIFGCDSWEVFSDVDAQLTPGPPVELWATKVLNVEGEFYQLLRQDKPKYINTPIFYQVWKSIRDHGKYQNWAWTVKVDPPTVFIPQRLRDYVGTQGQTPEGDYYENCQDVQSGFFGNIELTNLKAFTVFMTTLEDCKLSLCWKSEDKCRGDWKWGPWGEDKFMQECMDKHGVQKMKNFQLSTSGTCPADRPEGRKQDKDYVPDCSKATTPAVHPFRTPESYFACLGTIMQKDYTA